MDSPPYIVFPSNIQYPLVGANTSQNSVVLVIRASAIRASSPTNSSAVYTYTYACNRPECQDFTLQPGLCLLSYNLYPSVVHFYCFGHKISSYATRLCDIYEVWTITLAVER